ncbi:PAS domain S-box protein [Paenibacillus sp.]|uniref:PAS domain S-box protein n=1 Tax=Paenibacillus sp. TaxID=58172 RepID=UPI002D64BBBA|nr:PAS domain S-box protein [Paenibacillus sp.]HZG84249.1 PAS domain S-box protein [Paenibacillus sp.]
MDEAFRLDLQREVVYITSKAGQLLHRFQIPMWSWNLLTDTIIYSPAVEQIYGTSFRDFWVKSNYSEKEETLEFSLTGPDKRVRWYRQRVIPFYNADNKLVQIDGMLTDITEQRSAEEEFDAFLQTLVRMNPNPAYAIGLDGKFTEANRAAEELTGYSRDELLQMSCIQLLTGVSAEAAVSEIQRLASEKTTLIGDISIIHRSKHAFSVNNALVPQVRRGHVIGIVGFVRGEPLSPGVRHWNDDADLAEERNPYSFLWVEITDRLAPGKVLHCDKAFAAALGLSSEELAQLTWKELVADGSLPLFRQKLGRLFDKGSMSCRLEYAAGKTGTKILTKNYCMLSYSGGKRAICIVTKVVDAAERPTADHKHDPGRKLRMIMAERNISTNALSEMTGLSRGTISNLKSGKIGKPHRFTLRVIADALNIDVTELH